ncbi:MAG TPA: flavin reductase family protein [Paenalcaligenes hominis]|uniref:Flavin reductase family protein n=1 Tax=Paenalcaligenes hominis TaxID=643674 RepID=A0A9D2VI87_9BURK|nr:flavin reductase family protein [Paenalcaligenes hominis]
MSTQATTETDNAVNLFDSRAFRHALGHFPTGVAIVTTRTPDGRPVGLTINSFSSLSLEPPLIMWSLVNHSPSLSIFEQCNYFAINVISQQQVEAALGFANSQVEDKFALVSHVDGEEGVPLLDHCVATFVCENYQQHEGGDHTLFIGRVVRHSTITEHEPAVFHRGKFTRLGD